MRGILVTVVNPFGVHYSDDACWVDATEAADLLSIAPSTIHTWRSRSYLTRRAGTSKRALYDLREVIATRSETPAERQQRVRLTVGDPSETNNLDSGDVCREVL